MYALLRIHTRSRFLFFLLIGVAIVWVQVLRTSTLGPLTVAFLDVGQGDALFIETPGGRQILIDAGKDRAVLAQLGAMMPLSDRTLDLAIATHPDADHIGGFVFVLPHYDVTTSMETDSVADTKVYAAVQRAAAQAGMARITASRGMRVVADHGVVLEVLAPETGMFDGETNAHSIVARLTYGTTSFLLTGDAPRTVEHALVERDAGLLRADVLKVGHHGSRTSTSERFLAAVAPTLAVISVGGDNRYGHPHEVVLDSLAHFGLPVLRTDEDGAIILKSDGTQIIRSR